MRRNRRGFSLVELMVVVVMIALLTAIVIPRFRVTQFTRARQAADQLARDLEAVRSRALATRSLTRVVIDTIAGSYTAYLDTDRDGALAQLAGESAAVESFRTRALDADLQVGRGVAPDVPGYPGGTSVTLQNNRVDFDSRGLTTPLGTSGVVYLRSIKDPSAVAAVSISAASGIRTWVYQGGGWQ
jgi:prepilin-type N-terminal cleavage/methylation domain-containing protein